MTGRKKQWLASPDVITVISLICLKVCRLPTRTIGCILLTWRRGPKHRALKPQLEVSKLRIIQSLQVLISGLRVFKIASITGKVPVDKPLQTGYYVDIPLQE